MTQTHTSVRIAVAMAAGLWGLAPVAGAAPSAPLPGDDVCHSPSAQVSGETIAQPLVPRGGATRSNLPAASRSVVNVQMPAVRLRQQTGQSVMLAQSLDPQRPVLLNFVFTSCTTICPPMSMIFAAVQDRLGAQLEQVQMVSISIDPGHDTPTRLRDYAQRFSAGPQWSFHTGSPDAIDAMQKAFNVYRPDKMGHTPVTFVRRAGSTAWARLDGFAGPDQLLREAGLLGP